MDPILRDAKSITGEQRFYPPGQHPAMLRTRNTLDLLYAVSGGPSGLPPVAKEAESYLLQQLASFEEAESVAKARFLQRAT